MALQIGDRFYKLKDAKKEAWVMIEITSPRFANKSYCCCPSSVVDCKIMLDSHKRNRYRNIDGNTEVVFLKSTTV
ncbi:MAG: hypothetical protein WBP45_13205 [Daejeonella sp.]